jgi:hypothetical protein
VEENRAGCSEGRGAKALRPLCLLMDLERSLSYSLLVAAAITGANEVHRWFTWEIETQCCCQFLLPRR